jgi:hypothetical protein
MNNNDMQKIVEKTCKRIGKFTDSDFEHTMCYLNDYPQLRDNLLEAIRDQDAETVGKAFLLFIYTVNQDLIKDEYETAHEVTVKEENIPFFIKRQME